MSMHALHLEAPSWYHRRHHRPGGGFRNIWGPSRDVPFYRSAAWLLQRPFSQKENLPPPIQYPAPEALRQRPGRLRLTWLGHATTYIQTPALDLLADPIFSDRASPVSFAGPARELPLPLPLDALPGVDVVLISHDHYDHLDVPSIRQLQERFDPLFLVPLGVGARLRDWGARRVQELDWWQAATVDGFRYRSTPAKHFSGRTLTDRDETLWSGWYVTDPGEDLTLYYAGDTAYGPFFTEIRERLGAPEVAILPIGAYLPRWFMAEVHVDPREAVQAFIDLQADHFIPVHWGTFDLADEPIQEPAVLTKQHAAARGIAGRLHVLDVGETFSFPAAAAAKADAPETPAAMNPTP